MDIDTAADTQTPVQPTDVDPDEERRKRSGAILLAVVVALIVLWWILTQTTVVPNLTGLPRRRRAMRCATPLSCRAPCPRCGLASSRRDGRRPGPFAGVRVMKGSEIDFALAARVGTGLRDGGAAATSPAFGFSLTEDEIDSGSTLRDQETPRSNYVAQSVPMVQALTEAEPSATPSTRATGFGWGTGRSPQARRRAGSTTRTPNRTRLSRPAVSSRSGSQQAAQPGGFPYPSPVPDRSAEDPVPGLQWNETPDGHDSSMTSIGRSSV